MCKGGGGVRACSDGVVRVLGGGGSSGRRCVG